MDLKMFNYYPSLVPARTPRLAWHQLSRHARIGQQISLFPEGTQESGNGLSRKKLLDRNQPSPVPAGTFSE